MDENGERHDAGHTPGEPVHLDDTPLAGGVSAPPDRNWWTDVDRRHQRIILAAVIAGVVVLAIGIGVGVGILGSRLSDSGDDDGQSGIVPPVTTSSVPATSAPGSEATSTTPVPAPAVIGKVVRAPYLAYRADGAVWTAKEDGSGLKRAMTSNQGPFALSPDGGTLAVVDADSQTLTLIDVASGQPAVVGTAIPERPSWSSDSAFVVYSTQASGSHETEIDRVSRDGSGRTTLGRGSAARVAPDGSVVAVSASRTSTGTPLVVFGPGAERQLGTGISVNAVAPARAAIVFADAEGVLQTDRRPPSLRTIGYDGTSQRTLIAKPAGDGVFFGDIAVSPDSGWIAYAETGDDGYSRMFAVRMTGGTPIALSLRRDDYILGWSADGSEILFVDGNQTQGETPRVMAVKPDGRGRRIVAESAGL